MIAKLPKNKARIAGLLDFMSGGHHTCDSGFFILENEMVEHKICTMCGIEKPIGEFYFIKSQKNYRAHCKKCNNRLSKEYKLQHKEKVRVTTQRWYKANTEKCRAAARAQYRANPEKSKEYARAWQKANPDKNKEIRRRSRATRLIWQAKNQQRIKKTNLLWLAKNKDRHRDACYSCRKAKPEQYRDSDRRASRKRNSTPTGKLSNAIHSAISASLKGEKGYQKWRTLVGYTLDELRRHLEKQFKEGMSWNNYGKWHVDHIIPKSAFNYKKPEDDDFKRCWCLENLQPLWAKENIRKQAKLEKPFQPSLIFS